MPTLDWIGKQAVLHHHRDVPYRLIHCDSELSAGDPDSGNLLVQGDNLEALKALLPYYAGKVKCIYIDPPYNTGSEEWRYNDNVNSPEMKKWLGEVVGKEAEDLSRHDKWLCMMYPRLRLLREFLREDGAIFVSIDDNEVWGLNALLNEIFGARNRVETFIWKKSYGGGAKEKFAVTQHEYVFMYARNIEKADSLWLPPREEIKERYYKYTDEFEESRGPYRIKPLEATKSMDRRENLIYPIPSPDGIDVWPLRQWWWSKERTLKALDEGRLVFTENNGKRSVSYKQYLFDGEGQERLSKPFSIVDKIYTQQGSLDLRSIFDDQVVFSFPKPVKLIQDFVHLMSMNDKDCMVLDSFAGSGSTGHAVLGLNKQDGGNRKFILVEMEETIARDVTAERLERVIDGYEKRGGKRTEHVEGLGSGFRFCRLGKPLFDEFGGIDAEVTYGDLAAHIFFSETGSPIPQKADGNTTLLGTYQGRAVYLLYDAATQGFALEAAGNTLTPEVLAKLPSPAPDFEGARVVYAEGCTVSAERLNQNNTVFKQIPYQLGGA